MAIVTFGKRNVGDGEPCFISYEAGPTHDGIESAKALVKIAADSGADAIKFQIIDPDRLVADKKQLFSYEVLLDRETNKTETITEPLYDILCRRTLSREEWRELKKYSDSLSLAFFATIGFEDEIKFLEDLGCDSIKIASADVNHWPLIRKAARTGMCLQMDTGNSTIGEIEEAVDIILSEGNENIIIHNCPSGYPARLESINLRVIPTLKRIFPFPIAFSDHTPGWEMDIAAIALGANLVEKTITLDRTTRSIEHLFSLEPGEMKLFVQRVRELELALGRTRRIMTSAERKKARAVRRSAFLIAPVKKGQTIESSNIEFRRPGHGIAPNVMEKFFGWKFTRDLTAGHMISMSDIEES